MLRAANYYLRAPKSSNSLLLSERHQRCTTSNRIPIAPTRLLHSSRKSSGSEWGAAAFQDPDPPNSNEDRDQRNVKANWSPTPTQQGGQFAPPKASGAPAAANNHWGAATGETQGQGRDVNARPNFSSNLGSTTLKPYSPQASRFAPPLPRQPRFTPPQPTIPPRSTEASRASGHSKLDALLGLSNIPGHQVRPDYGREPQIRPTGYPSPGLPQQQFGGPRVGLQQPGTSQYGGPRYSTPQLPSTSAPPNGAQQNSAATSQFPTSRPPAQQPAAPYSAQQPPGTTSQYAAPRYPTEQLATPYGRQHPGVASQYVPSRNPTAQSPAAPSSHYGSQQTQPYSQQPQTPPYRSQQPLGAIPQPGLQQPQRVGPGQPLRYPVQQPPIGLYAAQQFPNAASQSPAPRYPTQPPPGVPVPPYGQQAPSASSQSSTSRYPTQPPQTSPYGAHQTPAATSQYGPQPTQPYGQVGAAQAPKYPTQHSGPAPYSAQQTPAVPSQYGSQQPLPPLGRVASQHLQQSNPRLTDAQQRGYQQPQQGYQRPDQGTVYSQQGGYQRKDEGNQYAQDYQRQGQAFPQNDRLQQPDRFSNRLDTMQPRIKWVDGIRSPEQGPPFQSRWSEESRQSESVEQGRRDRAAVITEEPMPRSTKTADPRRKKDKERDKGKRTFGAAESFLIDESALAAEQSAKEAKRERKKKNREKPIPIFLPQFVSVSVLANNLKVPLNTFLEKLKELGFEDISYDHVLNSEDAGLVAMEYNYEPVIDTSETEDLLPRPPPEDKSTLPARPPVVTIMGHVDHGKTTLLDFLRKSSVAANEHGGITQHIGAFSVTMPSGKQITFLDTPGHAAFLSMRERGANATDIVILVVAADDSVKPQTIEAIKHAKGANVPIIVAVNKIDKEDANVDRVKHDLAQNGIEIEDFGGDTQVIPVSAKKGYGMEELEEATVLLSEILDMRAEIDGPCEGYILEATTKKRGRVATILVRRGTLRPGDIIVAGQTWARVRNLLNEAGQEVPYATPGIPVEVDGWRDQPIAGDLAIQAPTEEKAKSVVEFRLAKAERLRQAADMEAINITRKEVRETQELAKLEQSGAEAAAAAAATTSAIASATTNSDSTTSEDTATKCKEVNFIIKADVSGSSEAVTNAITTIGNHEVRANIIRSSFGAVSEFDVDHASAANGTILSFNLPLDPMIATYARAKGVQIMQSSIIYRLVEDVTTFLSSFLPPLVTSRVTGEADILQIFPIKVKGKGIKPVAGCRIKTGNVARGARARVRRKGEIIYDGKIESLRNHKQDVTEMRQNTECGIGLEEFDKFEPGDTIQCYTEIVTPRTLN